MLVHERQRKIVELVNRHLSVRVSELSKIFKVTEETIRRDLEKLEKETLLLRSHGGAVSVQDDQIEVSYLEREIIQRDEKKAIAYQAVKWIEPGDKIILDASSTAWYMAKAISDMPVTVVTNSIKVTVELSKKCQIKVISTGGMLLPKSLSYVGPLAERSLQMYHVNKAFISCKGVHTEGGLSDTNEWQALIKREMMEIADQTFLIVDSSKFGVRTFANINDFNSIDHVITDSNIQELYKSKFIEGNVQVTEVRIDD